MPAVIRIFIVELTVYKQFPFHFGAELRIPIENLILNVKLRQRSIRISYDNTALKMQTRLL